LVADIQIYKIDCPSLKTLVVRASANRSLVNVIDCPSLELFDIDKVDGNVSLMNIRPSCKGVIRGTRPSRVGTVDLTSVNHREAKRLVEHAYPNIRFIL
jgi:hypothetical protein